jgi:hypothetical protein
VVLSTATAKGGKADVVVVVVVVDIAVGFVLLFFSRGESSSSLL